MTRMVYDIYHVIHVMILNLRLKTDTAKTIAAVVLPMALFNL